MPDSVSSRKEGHDMDMSASVEKFPVDDDDPNGPDDRKYALRLAKDIYPRGPEARLFSAASLFHEFMKEDPGRYRWSDLIPIAFVATDGLMPDDPATIIATARRLRDYVKTGDLPEPTSEVS